MQLTANQVIFLLNWSNMLNYTATPIWEKAYAETLRNMTQDEYQATLDMASFFDELGLHFSKLV